MRFRDWRSDRTLPDPYSAAVPTHFAKVLIASRPPKHPSRALVPSKQHPGAFADGKEWVQGAFVLPNEAIADETRLEQFVVPGELAASRGYPGVARGFCEAFFGALQLLTFRGSFHLLQSKPSNGPRDCLSCPKRSRRATSSTCARYVLPSPPLLESGFSHTAGAHQKS